MRLNRQRVAKCSATVKPDDVLTLALRGQVKVVKVKAAAERRGSAAVAQQLYEDLILHQNEDASP